MTDVAADRQRWDFPFFADYVAAIDGIQVRQTVEVLERFGPRYRIKALGNLRVRGIVRRLPAGTTIAVSQHTLRPVDEH